jgi:tRNA-specific 2-thiouridylase
VDSAVAAWLLLQRGVRVTAVTLDLWQGAEPDVAFPERSRGQVARAKTVAEHLGVRHVVVNARAGFQQRVVDYFVDEYSRGKTPNPCVKCNSRLRFGLLADVARGLGTDWFATGHYARLTGNPLRLARGADQEKDQSYVLAEVAPELLSQVVFPLGEMTKETVRGIARDSGLSRVVSEESQEICFIPDNDYRSFLRTRLGERPGPITDSTGNILGHHSGTYNYTVGQRKGLGHSEGSPLYVVAVDARRRIVLVGPEPAGSVGMILVSDLVIHRPLSHTATAVQLRAMARPVPASLAGDDAIVLHEPVSGVAPGQTAVLYADDDVVLAGTIVATRPWGHTAHCSSPTGTM